MVAPPIPPSNLTQVLPSRHFCQTGILEEGERYNQAIHNMGQTPQERCSRFYPEYRGGKRRMRKTRKSRKHKKSRKNRRKSKRRM